MTWGYVLATAIIGKRKSNLFVPAVLMLSVLPDIDMFLGNYGVRHQTFTHSLFFWLITLLPLLLFYRRRFLPYLIAVVQHFAFGDMFLGKIMIFWPFSSVSFGFNAHMLSILDVALEITGLILAAMLLYYNRDWKRLLSIDKRNIWMFFPFLALITSILFFAVDRSLSPLVSHILSNTPLSIIVFGHIILGIFLAISTIQGLRSIFDRTR
jgi:hypothetical protein